MTSPEDVRRHLRLRVLGVTPHVRPQKNGSASLLLSNGAPAQFAELLHAVRTNLVLAPELATARVLLVTSSEPGEGKTMAAANLAVSLARLNQSVLLIDADLRKPRLHEVFGSDRQPGLSDVLTKTATEGAFQETKVPGLWLMPSGTLCRNPTDLLGSERFATLIDGFRRRFDWVLLDSPPVLAVTDPCLIARVASGVLFVVGCGQTSRDKASAAVERLDAAGANIVGAMLNRIVLQERRDSYLSYYRPDYQPDDSQDNDVSWLPPLPVVPANPEPLDEETPASLAAPVRGAAVRLQTHSPAAKRLPNPWDI